MQGGVVPGKFPQHDAFTGLLSCFVVDDVPAPLSHHLLQRLQTAFGHHHQGNMGSLGHHRSQRRKVARDRPSMEADQLFDNAIRFPQSLTKPSGGHERPLKGHHHLGPWVGRSHRHLQFGDDAGQAPGMTNLMHVIAPQFDDLGLLGDRDHPQSLDVPPLSQLTIGDGANATATPSHKAPHRGSAIGGGGHPYLPAHLTGLLVDGHQFGSRLHPHHPWFGPDHLIQLAHIQHDAPLQGNALAIVAGARPPDGERDPPFGTDRRHLHHLRFVGRSQHQIRPLIPQLPL